MKLTISAALKTKLKKRGAVVDKKLRATKAQLTKICKEYDYALHQSVIDFETAFGGMVMPDEGTKLKKDEPCWLFGAHACITSGGHVDPRGGSKSRKLVPVVCSPNDVIYFLDAKGNAYAQDTIEDVSAVKFAKDPVTLVARILEEEEKFAQNIPIPKDPNKVDLSMQKLEVLPDSVWSNKKATYLNLSFNKFKELPEQIGELKELRELWLRGCLIETLPDSLAKAKNLKKLIVSECQYLDVEKTLQVITKLTKLEVLWMPLSEKLTSLAPLAKLPLKHLRLSGIYVKRPDRLPAGLAQLKKLTNLDIEYADEIELLPEAKEDIDALRVIFSKKFTIDDIRKSIAKQPEVRYLQEYLKTL